MNNNEAMNEYRISATEVLCILEYLPRKMKLNIPTSFLEFLKVQSIPDYKPKFDCSQGLDKIKLRNKTKALLAMVYRNYICSEEERVEYDRILSQNEETYQNELKEKYNPDNLWKKEKIENNAISEEVQLVEYKESFFNKFLNLLKKLIYRK